MIEKEFIPYAEALALKELGFDEPCIKYYWTDGMFTKTYESPLNHNERENLISAPLYQQAFRFFREKYKLHQYIKQYNEESFFFHIEDMVHPQRFEQYTIEMLRCFNESCSQEEAESKCLDKLIEIVKTK